MLEILMAAAIGAVVLGVIAQTFLGANKSQAIAVGTSMLKTAGQSAVDDIYKNLHQNRHLFDRPNGGSPDTTQTFLNRLPIAPYNTAAGALTPGLPDPDPTVDLVMPQIKDNGSFVETLAAGGANPDFDRASVGNALLFGTLEPQATLTDDANNVLMNTIGRTQFLLPATRLHFYYLARRSLGTTPPIRPGDAFVYWLMHFKSKPYLDYQEVVKWMNLIKDDPDVTAADADAFIAAKLTALAGAYAGALDLTADDAANAVYTLTPTSTVRNLEPEASTTPFVTDDFRTPIKFGMVGKFGEPMVAFNTTASSSGTPGVRVGRLEVPAYAAADDTHPYGFEVMVAGPKDARQALVRLVLTARTTPGGHMIDQTFQQIIQVYEYH